MDKLVVGYVGGDTNLDKVIQNFSGAVKYNITHAFTVGKMLQTGLERGDIFALATHIKNLCR